MWEGASTQWGQAKIISAAWPCGVERPCVGVAGKAQQSCGFGRKPAPGMRITGPCKTNSGEQGKLEHDTGAHVIPLKPRVRALLLSQTPSTMIHLVQSLFAAVVTSTSVALWVAFLAAFPLPFLFSIPPPASFSDAFCPIGPLMVRFCN